MSSGERRYPNNNYSPKKISINGDDSYKSHGHVSLTPRMLRTAVKRLQLRKAYVPSNLISEYFRRSYPIDSNEKKFNEELRTKLDCAVHVGLLLKHGEDAYYLPTLREEASALKTAFTAFWEVYRNYSKIGGARPRNQNGNCSKSKRKKGNTESNKSHSK